MLSALFTAVVVLCAICYVVDEVCSPVFCVLCGRRVCFVVCVLSILYLVLCDVLCCVVHHSTLYALLCIVVCGRRGGVAAAKVTHCVKAKLPRRLEGKAAFLREHILVHAY